MAGLVSPRELAMLAGHGSYRFSGVVGHMEPGLPANFGRV
jgi:hypothetical protein